MIVLPVATESRVDWFRVITDMQYCGWSHGRICRTLGRHKSWLAMIKNTPGAEPRFRDGQSLIELWHHVTGKPLDLIPVSDEVCLSAGYVKRSGK